jgi:Ca-activated chloride channel family protein
MTLPLLGPMSLTGFKYPWFLLFLFVVLALIGLYIIVQTARHKRMLRFANMELLESVAPKRPKRWRHLPAILLVLSLTLFTVAMAGPTHDVRIPRNRAVVMLVIDVSQSMRATDVSPSRLVAAQEAAKQFADQLTPGINLGLIAYAGTATVLVQPTTNRDASKAAIDKLQLADRTATGEGIFTALQAIATVGAVIGGGDEPPPARIVLMSDGKETVPSNPDNPKGAYTAARPCHSARRTATSRSTTSASPSPSTPRCSRRSPNSRVVTRTRRPASNSSRTCSPRCRSRSATRRSPATRASDGCDSVRSSLRWRRWRRC